MTGDFRHFVTYAHASQAFLKGHRSRYDGVVIPLSIISAFPEATYGFMRALCSRDDGKSYGIDPRTALFQRSWDRSKKRSTHQRVADLLGHPFDQGLNRPLEPSDFSETAIESCTDACIEYQLRFKLTATDARKLNKYKKLLGLSEIEDLPPPLFIVPPYFMASTPDDQWSALSMSAIRHAGASRDGVPVWPVLHFNNVEEWLPGALGTFEQVRRVGCRDVWLYPNDFREAEVSLDRLLALKDVVIAASTAGLACRMLHGGFCSILLQHHGLQGFANGIGYGEWRDSGYHRGGVADLRIYSLHLHRFISVPHADELLQQDGDYFGDDNGLFAAVLAEGRSFLEVTHREAHDHFMYCREQEQAMASDAAPDEIASVLRDTAAAIQQLEEPLPVERWHLSIENWIAVLEACYE